jgi:hypothetical protein
VSGCHRLDATVIGEADKASDNGSRQRMPLGYAQVMPLQCGLSKKSCCRIFGDLLDGGMARKMGKVVVSLIASVRTPWNYRGIQRRLVPGWPGGPILAHERLRSPGRRGRSWLGQRVRDSKNGHQTTKDRHPDARQNIRKANPTLGGTHPKRLIPGAAATDIRPRAPAKPENLLC